MIQGKIKRAETT